MDSTSLVHQVLDGPGLLSHLREHVAKSETVRFAVAFWGIGASEKLGLLTNKNVRIVCHLRLGGTNPREIHELMKFAQVRHFDLLHSKIYLFDQAGAVGSSNVSANGLSYQEVDRSGWFETNVAFGLGTLYTQIEQAFDDAWEASFEITPEDLEKAEAAWSTRRFRLPIEARSATLLEAALMCPEAFSDRRVFVWYSRYSFSERADVLVKNKQKETKLGSNLSAFEVYPDGLDEVPNNADVICFSGGPRGRLSDGEVWNLPLELESLVVEDETSPNETKNHLFFCTRVNGIGHFTKFPMKDWKSVIASIEEHEGSGAFVELGTVIRRVNASKPTLRPKPTSIATP